MKTIWKNNKNIIVWFGLGALYYCLVRYTAFSLPCPFRYLTGYLCPGCGITTMLLALSEGDFNAAKNANVFLYYTLFWLLLSVGLRRYYLSAGYVKILDRLLYPAYFLALVGFGIYRN